MMISDSGHIGKVSIYVLRLSSRISMSNLQQTNLFNRNVTSRKPTTMPQILEKRSKSILMIHISATEKILISSVNKLVR